MTLTKNVLRNLNLVIIIHTFKERVLKSNLLRQSIGGSWVMCTFCQVLGWAECTSRARFGRDLAC